LKIIRLKKFILDKTTVVPPITRFPKSIGNPKVLNKFVEELQDVANLDKKPVLEGKNMFIILSPKK
jgi:translation initiation factor IF-3